MVKGCTVPAKVRLSSARPSSSIVGYSQSDKGHSRRGEPGPGQVINHMRGTNKSPRQGDLGGRRAIPGRVLVLDGLPKPL